jgi:hypothetical protein
MWDSSRVRRGWCSDVAVVRTGPALAEWATTGANIRTEVADAADATVAWSLLDQYEPKALRSTITTTNAATVK